MMLVRETGYDLNSSVRDLGCALENYSYYRLFETSQGTEQLKRQLLSLADRLDPNNTMPEEELVPKITFSDRAFEPLELTPGQMFQNTLNQPCMLIKKLTDDKTWLVYNFWNGSFFDIRQAQIMEYWRQVRLKSAEFEFV